MNRPSKFIPADVRRGQEPFDWDRLMASLNAWDEAERQLSQAHVDMARELSSVFGEAGL